VGLLDDNAQLERGRLIYSASWVVQPKCYSLVSSASSATISAMHVARPAHGTS